MFCYELTLCMLNLVRCAKGSYHLDLLFAEALQFSVYHMLWVYIYLSHIYRNDSVEKYGVNSLFVYTSGAEELVSHLRNCHFC